MTKEHYNYVKVSQLLICFSIIRNHSLSHQEIINDIGIG